LQRIDRRSDLCPQDWGLRAFAKKVGYKIVGVWKETASGAKDHLTKRKEALALTQARQVGVILVIQLTRGGSIDACPISHAAGSASLGRVMRYWNHNCLAVFGFANMRLMATIISL
jgi:hypothetical protein